MLLFWIFQNKIWFSWHESQLALFEENLSIRFFWKLLQLLNHANFEKEKAQGWISLFSSWVILLCTISTMVGRTIATKIVYRENTDGKYRNVRLIIVKVAFPMQLNHATTENHWKKYIRLYLHRYKHIYQQMSSKKFEDFSRSLLNDFWKSFFCALFCSSWRYSILKGNLMLAFHMKIYLKIITVNAFQHL